MRFLPSVTLLSILFACAAPAYAGNLRQLAKLTASNGFSGDGLGAAIAAEGNIVFAGAPGHQFGRNISQGVVYAFVKPATGWTDMTQTATLTGSDSQAYDTFGTSVAMSGNTLVVGAPRHGPHCTTGRAYVFVRTGSSWTSLKQVAELSASDGVGCDDFGSAVAIAGNTIAVGADLATDNGVDAGAVYVFVEPAGGWKNMHETAKLTSTDPRPGAYLGLSVDTDGKTVVAGAPEQGYTGEADVYVEPPTGWTNSTETAKLTGHDSYGVAFFGDDVSISGSTISIGSPEQFPQMNGAGYIFVEPPNGWTNSTETAELTATNSEEEYLGSAARVRGSLAFMGAPNVPYPGFSSPGNAYIYAEPAQGWQNTNTFNAELTPSDGFLGDNFGFTIALSGNNIVVGSIFAHWDPNFENPGPGAAYIFGQ